MLPTLQNAHIAVIGLGYVGLPLAAEFGKKYKTVGFDINATRIEALKQGRDHTQEMSPEELAAAKLLAVRVATRALFVASTARETALPAGLAWAISLIRRLRAPLLSPVCVRGRMRDATLSPWRMDMMVPSASETICFPCSTA